MTMAPPPKPAESLVCFRVSDRRFALDVSYVREVLSLDRIWPVPRTPPAIAGIVLMRGTPLVVVDTPRLLGFDAPEGTSERATSALLLVDGDTPICAMTMSQAVVVSRDDRSTGNVIALDGEDHEVIAPEWLFARLETLRP